MRSLLRKLALVMGLAVGLLVLAGCGGSSSEEASKSESSGETRIQDRNGWYCAKAELTYGLCPNNPYYGLKPKAAAAARKADLAESESALHWAGKDFNEYNDQVAYKWLDASCGAYGPNACWAMNVKTKYGCDSLYVEVQIQNKARTAIDWSNDTASHLAPMQVAKLEFSSYEGGAYWARVVEMNCY